MKQTAIITLCILGLVLSWGSHVSAATLGETCPLSDPCEDPYECVSGVCRDTKNPGLPISDPVGPCRNDTDCPANYICENSACTSRSVVPVGPCRNDTDCSANSICVNNACTARLPTTGGGSTGTGSGSTASQGPGRDFTIQDVFNIIVGLTCWLTRIAIFLIVIALLYYGFLFMRAQGDPGKLGEAKKAFAWGLVGIIVILGTYSIIATVAYTVGGTAAKINPIPINCSTVR